MNWLGHVPPHWQCKTDEEAFVCAWQYRLLGGFYATLADAIAKADSGNRARLMLAFPVETAAVTRFKTEPGWWPSIDPKREGK